jgi:hypothetical protein
VDHKLYHHIIALVSLGAIVTGLVMMVRIDTPFWVRNPYLLSDQLWGAVYVVHGVTGVALITLVMAHVYFAIRPEKWWITRSMVRGWVGRKEYLAHHDPVRWVVVPEPPTTVAGVGSMNPGKGPPAGDPPSPESIREQLRKKIEAVEESYEFFLAYAAQGVSGAGASRSEGQVRYEMRCAVQMRSFQDWRTSLPRWSTPRDRVPRGATMP